MKDQGFKVQYLHHEIDTLKRPVILRDFRLGKYDILIGINLLREGLDLPEVSLILILDADKEGFLRSSWALIQTIGRAARNINGEVIMYADKITNSIKTAIGETERRRKIQQAFNSIHHITPTTIQKKIQEELSPSEQKQEINIEKIPADEIKRLIKIYEAEMDLAAKNLQFEKAAEFRDQIIELKSTKSGTVKLNRLLFE